MSHRFLILATLALLTACASDSRRDDPGAPDSGTATEPTVPERSACSGLTVGPGTYDWTVQHEGRTRVYRVHVPPGYDATRPTPAVLAFHGFTSTEKQMEGLTQLSTLANTEGFLAVYPRGLNLREISGNTDPALENTQSWNGGACCAPARDTVDDVGFVDALLTDLDTRVCVDTRRTFAMGFSNGGFFTYRLACERASRFAAVAAVAGTEGISACTPSRPVPVLHFHGTADDTIYYPGGNNIGPYNGPYPSAEATVQRWVERNRCGNSPTQTYQKGDSTCVAYPGCAPESATVSLCTIQGGKHAWPGFALYNNGTLNLDATREAWKFFKARPRP
jgi:polyhydroxybutyrate depolymerase